MASERILAVGYIEDGVIHFDVAPLPVDAQGAPEPLDGELQAMIDAVHAGELAEEWQEHWLEQEWLNHWL